MFSFRIRVLNVIQTLYKEFPLSVWIMCRTEKSSLKMNSQLISLYPQGGDILFMMLSWFEWPWLSHQIFQHTLECGGQRPNLTRYGQPSSPQVVPRHWKIPPTIFLSIYDHLWWLIIHLSKYLWLQQERTSKGKNHL